ncbi:MULTISPECIES: helix-turn-helix domain-containing protein [unclassified Mesorhizobium]|uniref:helix-turn-helix domain-containing protein n=1 Tax=unclassified Mesorhizobium TaxID=325217 RepID=UPI00112AD9C1|nr:MULTISPECIES: helix-turn-helix domain-containing protein [unclassified Mesorhizobium]TPJ46713.1 helix-turn-helix domain-containing protein [Mesorhizobium sp. B2-6-6]MBZ9919086.1 helix-turn-helix domain-containing protein [Mesorhizobium sp. BR1-1-7]MBZ9970135.1 helix-turn-helix domain-containing protein [Mesorhizobium sp. BR1-1-12]MCA0000981.1 helix-turn-helix domain-containing protein [Mesorhizobium sp. B264B2A]MCA0004730.1 helix-turn-helix domain-containing protein [Mesorhizobium sp. B264B
MLDAIARNEKQIGAILRRARRKAGLTQEALGDRAHLRQGTISHLEAGKPTVQLRTLMATLSSLGLEIVVRRRSRGNPADFEDLF